jgi:hypothetical protein
VTELSLINIYDVSERSLNHFMPVLQRFSGLTSLRIGGDKDATSKSRKRLVTCDVKLRDPGAELLVQALSRAEPKLEDLSLRFNFIGDKGASALAEFVKITPTLEMLDLESNEIGDDGARDLAKALSGHPSMASLYLEDNTIADMGASAFARYWLKKRQGRSDEDELLLSLINNNVGDRGAIAIANALEKNEKMGSGFDFMIDLTRNNVSDEGANALFRAARKQYEAAKQTREGDVSTTIVLAECPVSAAVKVMTTLERSSDLIEWSDDFDRHLIKTFKIPVSRVRGWLLVTGQLLNNGMDALIPDGDVRRARKYRPRLPRQALLY